MKYNKVTKHGKKNKQDVEKIVKGFDWNRVSWFDKEYLSGMIHDTVNAMSFRETGQSFTLFNDEKAVQRYTSEFYNTALQASHLLNRHPKGRKYYFVWSYIPNEES